MKRMFLVLMALACCGFSNAGGFQDNQGLFLSLGAGLSPIYIEEIITLDELSVGASALTGNSLVRVGSILNDNLAVYLQADYNWYQDALANTYAMGLLNPGVRFQLTDFFNSYFLAGVGLANLTVIGNSENIGGTGFNLGFGFDLGEHLATEASYSHLNLNEVAAHFGGGDQQVVNALNVRLTISWH